MDLLGTPLEAAIQLGHALFAEATGGGAGTWRQQ
jgi:hypothetical protein